MAQKPKTNKTNRPGNPRVTLRAQTIPNKKRKDSKELARKPVRKQDYDK